MSSSPARSPSPPTTNLPFQPQISPYTQGFQSNPSNSSNYPWPQPSTYNPSMPLPNGPYSIPPDERLLRPAAQPPPPPQSSSRPNVDPPPMKPPTDDQLWKLVQYYLYSSNELRSPVVYTSSLVIIFGFDDRVTAESLARTIRSFSIRNHNTGEKEYPYEKTLIRTWLIRSRLPNAETYSDGTLKSTNIKHSGSTSTSPLGCSWRFAFASFDKPSMAYSFYKDFNPENGFGPKLPLNPSCKIKMANPLKAFVRLEPDDEAEFENMRYGWKGVGLKGWDGVRREGSGKDLTFWSIEDDRVGSDMWIASEYDGERGTSPKGEGKRPSQSVYEEERKASRSRSRGWEVEDDDDDVVVTGSSKGIPQDRSNSDEGSRKKPRLDQDLGSDDIGSTNSNDRTEKSRKVPVLPGSKKVAKDISKWQTKQSELHQDPPSSSSDSQPQPPLSKSNSLPTQSSTATPVMKEVPMDYDFADLVKKACLLCVRQFKTIEMLRRHEADSALHKGNLSKDELRKAGYDRKTSALNKRAKTDESEKKIPNGFAPINSNPIPTSSSTKDDASSSFSIDTTSKYRDRASERRSVFGADKPSSSSTSSSHRKEDKRKVFEGPAPVLASEESELSSNHNREEEIDESNSGFKMLAQMGWTKGKGLGTESQGRSSIVEAGHHRMGAGLGSGSSNGNDRHGSEEGRGYKGGYKGGKKSFDKGYLEAMRDSARERFEGK